MLSLTDAFFIDCHRSSVSIGHFYSPNDDFLCRRYIFEVAAGGC